MSAKRMLSDRIFYGVLYTIMTCISVLLLYPLLWVVMTSLADPVWLSSHQVLLWPGEFSLDAYQFILSDSKLWTSYAYSVFYTAVTLVCTLFFCTFLAYPLSLPQFKARKAIGVFVLLPMFLSGGMIPEFTTISRYGLLDTVWALALPASASTLYVILMRGNFSQISGELREAALIDGASEFQIFYRIVLPLAKVILVIISLYAIVDSWNNFTCYAFSQPGTRGLGSPKNVRVDVHTLCLQNLPGWKRSLSTGFPRVIARLRPSGFQ